MQIYNYHPGSGLFIGQAEADPDPMEKGKFLIPAYATPDQPIDAAENQAAVYRDPSGKPPLNHQDGKWQLVPDFRGKQYWLPDGTEKEIEKLGEKPPEEALFEKPPEPIEELAKRKRSQVDGWRDEAFSRGADYTFTDGDDVIQTRPQDKVNLLGLVLEANALMADGIDEPAIEFRALSNKARLLTPSEAVSMADAALTYIKAVYKASWDLKDSIEAMLAEGNREGIEQIEWPSETQSPTE